MTNEAGLQDFSFAAGLSYFDMKMPDGQMKRIHTFSTSRSVSESCKKNVRVDVAKRVLHLRLAQLGRLHHGLSVMIENVDDYNAPMVIDQMAGDLTSMSNFEFWNFQYQQQTPTHNASQSEALFGEHIHWHLLPAQMTVRKETLSAVDGVGEFTYFRGPIGPSQYRQYRVTTDAIQIPYTQQDLKNEIRRLVEIRIGQKPELWREWRNIIRSVNFNNQHIILSVISMPVNYLWEFEVDNFLSTENWALPRLVPQPTETHEFMPPPYVTPPPSCSPSSAYDSRLGYPVHPMQFYQQNLNYTPQHYSQSYQIPNAFGYAVQAQVPYPGYTMEPAPAYQVYPARQQQFPVHPPAYPMNQPHYNFVPSGPAPAMGPPQAPQQFHQPEVFRPYVREEVPEEVMQEEIVPVATQQNCEQTMQIREFSQNEQVAEPDATEPIAETAPEIVSSPETIVELVETPIVETITDEQKNETPENNQEQTPTLKSAVEAPVEIDEKLDENLDASAENIEETSSIQQQNEPSSPISPDAVVPTKETELPDENPPMEGVTEELADDLEKVSLEDLEELERLKEEKRDKKRVQRQKKAAAKKQEKKNNKRIESELKQAHIAQEKRKKEAKHQAMADAEQERRSNVQLKMDDEDRIKNLAPVIVKSLRDVNTDEKKALLAVPLPNLPEEIIDVIRKSLNKNIITNAEIENGVNNAIIGSALNPVEIIQKTIEKTVDKKGNPKYVSPSNIEVKLLERIAKGDPGMVPRYAKILDRIYRKSVASVQLKDKSGKPIELGEKEQKPRNPNANKRAAERDVYGFSEGKPLFLIPFPSYPVPTYVATQRLLALVNHENISDDLRHKIMKSLTNNSRRLQASYFLLFIYSLECLLPDVYNDNERLLWLYLEDLMEMRFFSSRENSLVSNWTAAFASHVDFEKPGQAIPDHLVNGIAALLVQRPKTVISKSVAAKWKDAEEKLVKLMKTVEDVVSSNK